MVKSGREFLVDELMRLGVHKSLIILLLPVRGRKWKAVEQPLGRLFRVVAGLIRNMLRAGARAATSLVDRVIDEVIGRRTLPKSDEDLTEGEDGQAVETPEKACRFSPVKQRKKKGKKACAAEAQAE